MGKAAGTKSALAASSPQALRPRCGKTPGDKANLSKRTINGDPIRHHKNRVVITRTEF
jgi:hypothetical protein